LPVQFEQQAMETFVIQIPTRPENSKEASQEEFRGVVEHVGTGRRQPFTSARELIEFLHADHCDPREFLPASTTPPRHEHRSRREAT
jgi:hypothetical protein